MLYLVIFKHIAKTKSVLSKFVSFFSIFFYIGITLASEIKIEENDLRAAFIVKFLKYIELPKSNQNVNICVIGTPELTNSFSKYNNKTQSNMNINLFANEDTLKAKICDLLYLSVGAERSNHFDIVSKSDLVICELDDCYEQSGIIKLEKRESSIIFKINLKRALEHNIKISSQLLTLASEIIEN